MADTMRAIQLAGPVAIGLAARNIKTLCVNAFDDALPIARLDTFGSSAETVQMVIE